jgi:chromosome segregation ATPase
MEAQQQNARDAYYVLETSASQLRRTLRETTEELDGSVEGSLKMRESITDLIARLAERDNQLSERTKELKETKKELVLTEASLTG